ncbi:MAG: helix-turn-helix domain-containing protein [Candidatus Paceibacterota bacterium]|jgi:sugar-specific transcriptional regulator TrmB
MNQNTDEKILIEAGLSEEQSAIYSALLDKGPLKAGSIATWTGLKRGLIYKVLDQLENMGLVSKKGGDGTVAVFAPEHPSQLAVIMERKEKSFALAKETVNFSLGALSSKFNLLSGKPNVQFYEGKDGVEKVLEDTLNAKGEVLTYADIEIVEKYFKKINEQYVAKREKFNIKKRALIIENDFSKKFFNDLYNKDPEYFSITDVKMAKTSIYEVEGAIQIYENKIGIITISNENLISIIIEDERINKLFKSMFEALYLVSPRFIP